jgi:protein phosphatase
MLSKKPKLIEIKKVHPVRNINSNGARKVVFVGDTHGDLEVSQKVIKEYLKPGNKVVFLGDYVDRGPFSKENLDYLLQQKEKFPDQIFLLQGNHEGHRVLPFSPADFWESLSEDEYKKYTEIVEKFPLVAVVSDIIALHGALPDVKNLKEINKIKLGSEQWLQTTWGDFVDEKGEYLGVNPSTGRPQFGRDWFEKLMKRFNKKILVRSHQPTVPRYMFGEHCLTIFSSQSYTTQPIIAIADLTKEIRSAKDLKIVKITTQLDF